MPPKLLSVVCDSPKTLGSAAPDPGLITCNTKVTKVQEESKMEKLNTKEKKNSKVLKPKLNISLLGQGETIF